MTDTHTQPSESPPPAPVFSLTDAAARRIAYITSDEPAGTRLRIGIGGGGCSGFQYQMDLDSQPLKADDQVFAHNGSEVVVDEISLGMLAGSQLDYVETLGSAGFEVRNPNATANCGCGNSFSV